jgi:hypothetical protein
MYHADTLAECCRKATKDGNGGIEPLFSAPTITLRLNELLDIVLPVKYVEDSARRLAILQLGGKLMCEKVFLGLLFIVVQSSDENRSKIGRGG